ncbi:hypothetical protein ACFZCU_45655 [Streptomyces canus]|uniref:hypothetical protein n=1 Tax=Streptomyces canus TaxID=58343 RepID=UPI0036ED6D32
MARPTSTASPPRGVRHHPARPRGADHPCHLGRVTDYVNAGRELLGDDGDAYKKAITARYPAYQGAALIDVANAYMFAPKS